MNGNRWVGTGHNSVFQDVAGQWWTIYHAVDQARPVLRDRTRLHQATRPARRARLGERLAHRQRRGLGLGHQEARTGRPARAAQPYRTRLVETTGTRPGPDQFADEFAGTSL